MLHSRDLETVSGEDIRQAIDPATGRAAVLLVLDEAEEGFEVRGGEEGVGIEDAAVGGVGFLPLDVAAWFCFFP